jgi:hypothetical protein
MGMIFVAICMTCQLCRFFHILFYERAFAKRYLRRAIYGTLVRLYAEYLIVSLTRTGSARKRNVSSERVYAGNQ